MKTYFLLFYLVLFALVWLGITGYTLAALLSPSLPYSLTLFAIFLLVLDALAFPLIWLWWRQGSKTILHKTAVMMATLLVVLWWGVFTVYSFLSLHLNDLQFRWIAFAYIWEVVVVGAAAAFAVVRISRLADQFLSGKVSIEGTLQVNIHERIATIPRRAGITFTAIVIFGYVVGSIQLYYFSGLPFSEIVKNLLAGLLTGITGSFLVFLLLERIIDPALKKSGALAQGGQSSKKPLRLSLFQKIYAISALLVLVSIGFFGTMAYGRGQSILEGELTHRLIHELTWVKLQFEKTGRLPGAEEVTGRFGAHGKLLILPRPTPGHPEVLFPPAPSGYEEIFTVWKRTLEAPYIFIDRNRQTKIAGTFPIDDTQMLGAIAFLKDFDQGLTRFLLYTLYLFLMLLGLLAIVGTFFARSITLPVREIQEGSARMGKGDFSQPITVYTNDELEDLSHALNEASAQLKASYARLEEEVHERTYQLTQANKLLQEQISQLDNTSKLLVRRDFELQQANEMLRELDQAKTQFVSVAAHQLRTPLSVSKWTFQMLLSGDFGELTKEARDVLERGNAMNEQMIELVSDLLDVARIESGRFGYIFKPIDAGESLLEVKNLFGQKVKEKNLTFTIQIPEKGKVYLNGDTLRLRMAFENLIDNAIKFNVPGGSVTLSFEQREKMIEFRIQDTGIGIRKEDFPRLFSKFFRGRNAISFDTRGTGLGLYIAANIIRAHGGDIWVESKEGKGSTFFFTLPVGHP